MEEKLIQRLEAAVIRLESIHTGEVFSTDMSDALNDPSIAAFDDLLTQFLGKLSASAEKVGGVVHDATKIIEEGFATQKELIIKARESPKPGLKGLTQFLSPLNAVIVKANALTEGRRSDYFNHLKAVSDSAGALAWIAYTGKECGMRLPISHVEDNWEMAEFYSNKVLMEYKNKDTNHVEWAKALKELYITGLKDYVKRFYPLGITWSSTIKTKTSTSCAPSALSSSSSLSPSSRPKDGMSSALLNEINAGKSVTSGLRKVTDDMKTKNRADRSGAVSSTSSGEGRSESPSISKSGPPRLELQMGRKWVVENQVGRGNLVIEKCDSKQSVYVFRCRSSVLQIKGKVNNITVDNCTKMGIVFKDVVAACEVVNCSGVEVQCEGSVPSVSVDNTAGCQLYLNTGSLGASITTSKSSEINVLVPASVGDWGEHPLPQQFIHTYKEGRFTTSPVCHSGA